MSVFTPDQEELRRYVRRWLDERATFEEVRRIMESEAGYEPDQWREIAQLGWLGMAVPDSLGGAGYGFRELAIVAEEMGRTLYPSPYLSTVGMAIPLIEQLGSAEQQAELLGPILSGDRRVTVAEGEVVAEREGGGWRVMGESKLVVDGAGADTVLVVAAHGSSPRVFIVDATDGVGVSPQSVIDLTRPMANLSFDSRARLLGDGEGIEPALASSRRQTVGLLTMEQVGGAQACLDMSVDYAKNRYQFGRPIGSFQAIKHMCADMLVDIESAKSAAYHLAWALDEDPEEAVTAASLAKSFCSEAYYRVAADTIQIHGGIGFTWEHNAHLYLKRAKASQILLGTPAAHRQELAARLGV